MFKGLQKMIINIITEKGWNHMALLLKEKSNFRPSKVYFTNSTLRRTIRCKGKKERGDMQLNPTL
jgi:hypothetical protein